MPIRTFWFLDSCIERVVAQNELRALRLKAVQNAEEREAKEAIAAMQKLVIGEATVKEEEDELDSEGLAALKAMQ